MKKVFLLTLIALLSISSCKKKDSSYSLNISKNNKGTVNYETGKHPIGETISLEATPDEGYAFIGWHGEGLETPTDENPLTIVLDSNKSIVANFVNIENPDFSGMGLWTDEIYSSIDWDFKNNFRSVVEAFVKDAERHGLDLSYVLEGKTEFFTADLTSAAAAYRACNNTEVRIGFDNLTYDHNTKPERINGGTKVDNDVASFWSEFDGKPFYGDVPAIFRIMYHELGHDILNLMHICEDGQFMTVTTGSQAATCPDGFTITNRTRYSWYSNDPMFSFRGAVKDLFEGTKQLHFNCSN